MHDALVAGVEVEERNPELFDVLLDGPHHLLGLVVLEGAGLAFGGDDMVDRGEGAVGVGHLQALFGDHVEGLGAGDLVDQMQADEELVLARGEFFHHVGVPDFVVQSSFCHKNLS